MSSVRKRWADAVDDLNRATTAEFKGRSEGAAVRLALHSQHCEARKAYQLARINFLAAYYPEVRV